MNQVERILKDKNAKIHRAAGTTYKGRPPQYYIPNTPGVAQRPVKIAKGIPFVRL